MSENYGEASIRHYVDAEALAHGGRYDGAGHLIGFSAECAIKFHIETIKPEQDAPHGHFPSLIEIAKRHIQQRRQSTMHQILKNPDLLKDWDVSHRYSETGSTSQQVYDVWRGQAAHIMFAAGLKR